MKGGVISLKASVLLTQPLPSVRRNGENNLSSIPYSSKRSMPTPRFSGFHHPFWDVNLGGGNSNIFIFTMWGRFSFWLFFQRGWFNHQLVFVFWEFFLGGLPLWEGVSFALQTNDQRKLLPLKRQKLMFQPSFSISFKEGFDKVGMHATSWKFPRALGISFGLLCFVFFRWKGWDELVFHSFSPYPRQPSIQWDGLWISFL